MRSAQKSSAPEGEDKLEWTIRHCDAPQGKRSHEVWWVINELLRRNVPISSSYLRCSIRPTKYQRMYMTNLIHANMPNDRSPKPGKSAKQPPTPKGSCCQSRSGSAISPWSCRLH